MKKYILTQTQIDKLRSNWTLGATLENELDALKPIEPLSDEVIDALWATTRLDPDGNDFVPYARAIERHIVGSEE